ncbi:MAG: hypothetical protein A3C58_02295 [Candidatus Staskawiczbacteria bacterium RIFCSPHIGHO2_02_FULL_34_10]|uniref:Uncharacterized protein n=2 Tax=Candidatus Staskawicziibacteriota TaxID=1817916 RepID=A0A1G2HLP4_9BACT|nr:MAG: hypothetical protein A2639_02705 [Candidatus Staskawiczbacteria bacterium RIFCSPHIGHO2_01_FULL_34_27]OGZ65866.1 MAG: hypothetical protein A3C58_02295 [Candidatus Staskawiczbacteria bacterium RIFCSPHIGHO2_02_FULL_34_10]
MRIFILKAKGIHENQDYWILAKNISDAWKKLAKYDKKTIKEAKKSHYFSKEFIEKCLCLNDNLRLLM